MKLLLVCLLCFLKVSRIQSVCEAENQYPWSYHGSENGPSQWGELFPSCNRPDQGPIAIFDNNTYSGSPELELSGFEVPVIEATIENLGWTVQITPTDNYRRVMKYAFAYYELQNIRFHFGSESNPGAENVVNDVRHPMEIELYMIASDSEFDNAYAILSTLVEVQDNDTYAFGQITEALADIRYKGDTAELEYFFIYLFLPEMTGGAYSYYSYERLSSTPPCDQDPIRMILKDINYIGRNQLDYFLRLFSVGEEDASDECMMGPNYRPLQGSRNETIFSGQYHPTPASSEY